MQRRVAWFTSHSMDSEGLYSVTMAGYARFSGATDVASCAVESCRSEGWEG
jgi:hypothetical protein